MKPSPDDIWGRRAQRPSRGLKLLVDAHRLVEQGWCRGTDARASDGRPVDPWDPRARSWSLLGGIVAVLEREAADAGEVPLDELAAALSALAELVDDDSLARWNDDPGRSQTHVLETLHAAQTIFEDPWPDAASFSPN